MNKFMFPDWTRGKACIHGPATAQWGGKLVEFAYKTGDIDYPLETRQVKVEYVFAFQGRLYLNGFCMKHKEVRSYRMDASSMHVGRGETCAIREVIVEQPALL